MFFGLEQVIFRNIYVSTYMHAVTMKEDATHLKESGKGYMEGFRWKNRKEKNVIIISKIKKK